MSYEPTTVHSSMGVKQQTLQDHAKLKQRAERKQLDRFPERGTERAERVEINHKSRIEFQVISQREALAELSDAIIALTQCLMPIISPTSDLEPVATEAYDPETSTQRDPSMSSHLEQLHNSNFNIRFMTQRVHQLTEALDL